MHLNVPKGVALADGAEKAWKAEERGYEILIKNSLAAAEQAATTTPLQADALLASPPLRRASVLVARRALVFNLPESSRSGPTGAQQGRTPWRSLGRGLRGEGGRLEIEEPESKKKREE